jgi:hypothetical protein
MLKKKVINAYISTILLVYKSVCIVPLHFFSLSDEGDRLVHLNTALPSLGSWTILIQAEADSRLVLRPSSRTALPIMGQYFCATSGL